MGGFPIECVPILPTGVAHYRLALVMGDNLIDHLSNLKTIQRHGHQPFSPD